jgi:hypothetical protein
MRRHNLGTFNPDCTVRTVAEADSIGRKHRRAFFALSLTGALLPAGANAQEPNNGSPEQPMRPTATPKVIKIWPGVAPGSIRASPLQPMVPVRNWIGISIRAARSYLLPKVLATIRKGESRYVSSTREM